MTVRQRKKVSPVVVMAETSLLSQKAAMKKATNFEALVSLQLEELPLCKEAVPQDSYDLMMTTYCAYAKDG
jgi:hypothetical protein